MQKKYFIYFQEQIIYFVLLINSVKINYSIIKQINWFS